MKIENKNRFGERIRQERKRAGLTQKELGNLIGLTASRVSKIENGAPITFDVASFILKKIDPSINLVVTEEHAISKNTIDYLMPIIRRFALFNNISLRKAYRYLKTFNGMDLLLQFEEIEQTRTYQSVINDLNQVCTNSGGRL